MQKLLNPSAYTMQTKGFNKNGVTLRGGQCSCGNIFFPIQEFGCEKCGAYATQIQEKSIVTSGQLIASAQVHLHFGGGPKAPFVIGSIKLDEGPIVRALLSTEKSKLNIGDAMIGELTYVNSNEDGDDIFDLRFKKKDGVNPP